MERVDLRSLLTRGIPLEEQFNKLVDESEELLPFLEELRPWLKECIEFGRFLVDPSPERRALQGRVDFWTSRLSQSGVWEGDIDRIADFDPTAGIPLDHVCPYPGLEPYTPDRRASFFGGEALIASYVAHLQDQSRRILLIIGASGSGKSSLALAGVVPKLQERHTDVWLFAPRLTPGVQPLAALAASVAEAIEAPAQAEEIARSLAAKPDETLTQFAALCRGKPLMLLIDQFEELLTLCRDPAEQKAFADVLCALSVPDSAAEGFSCRMLLTLRTDHLARFESSDVLKPLHTRLVGENNYRYLATIGFDDIKRAIAEPAKQVGLRFVPPTLIDRLASQTAGLANGLPLLQYALRRLWDTRPVNAAGQRLDLVNEQMVDALPDVQRALGKVADDIFQTFSEEQKRICERLLQELVVLDETFEEPLRRRRDEAQLLAVLEARFSATFAGAAEIIERFVNAGLLRRFGEGNQRQLEVAHEALLRHWPHINQLVTGGKVKERLHLIKQIGREAAEWASHGHTDSYLTLRGERLKGALKYAKDRWLDEVESADYVRACNDREDEEKRRDEEAREHRRRAEEAQRAAEQAEKREAIAKARQKQSQLWLVISLATLAIVFGGAAFWISRSQTSREASLSAFAAHAASLPPWEGLDVAYTAAQHGGTALRFALAHALERMEDTWLLGSERSAGLALNRDGSALFQFDGAQQSLHLYPVGGGGKPDKPITIALPGRLNSLVNPQNNIGPPINGKSNERLVLLFFLDAKGAPGYLVEAHHVSAERHDWNTFTLPVQADAPAISAIDFQADGKGAVFSAINYGTLSSTIYRLTWHSAGKAALLPVDDPVTGEDRARSVVSAVAFGADARGSTAALITGRLDGSVYCDTKALTSASADAVSDPSPVGQIVTLSASDTIVVVHASGSMYAGSCASGTKTRVDTQGNAASVALTSIPKDQGAMLLLTYLDGTQLHCLVQVDKQKNQWVERFCNPSHQVGTSVPLRGGHQVTAEMGRSAVHAYPVEVLAAGDRLVGARRAGSTVVRWKLPVRPAENDHRLLPPSDPSDKDLPWKSESNNTWAAGTDERLITFAALSPEGKQIVWIEQRQTASHTDWLADLASQEKGKGKEKISLVVRTWTIGSDSPARVPNQPGRAVIAAISNDGLVAHGQKTLDGRAQVYLNAMLVDTLGPTGNVVACLAFSRNGRWLVAGTGAGKVRAYALQRDGRDGMATVPKAPTSWVEPFTTETDKRPRRITSCAVGDDGVLSVGNSEGQVVLGQPSGTWQDLTERAAFQFSAPVKAVTIDPDGRHVAALADWQHYGCSRPGLPGQALHVWDVTLPDKSWPVANACFPNQMVLAIGDLDHKRGNPSIPLVSARDIRWHACPGCARERESPEEMLQRLLRDAVQEAKAQPLDRETLNARYGMRFQ